MRPTMESTKIWLAISLAKRSVYRSIEVELSAQGLPSLRWFDVLWVLEYHKNGARPFELENMMVFEQSSLSRILRKIVDAGYAHETTYQNDKRGKILHITKNGSDMLRKMWEVYGRIIDEKMSKIPDDYDTDKIIAAMGLLSGKDVDIYFE